jgi:hypothetical protein
MDTSCAYTAAVNVCKALALEEGVWRKTWTGLCRNPKTRPVFNGAA